MELSGVKRWAMRLLVGLLCLVMLIQIWIFCSLWWWRTHPVETTMFMRSYYFTAAEPHLYHEWRDYNQISPYFKRAVIASEDQRFMQHHGFDWDGIIHALQRNEDRGKVVGGGSTISQQTAKNLFLYNQRSLLRKGQEASATLMMERMWSKRRILEVYMNSVELGEGIYGVEAAAQHYYGVHASQLSRSQAVRLAAMLPSPRYDQRHPNSPRHRMRERFIQRYLDSVQIPRNTAP